jgi:CheY-like chemotaxis protein
MDIYMPRMDGLEATRRLKASEAKRAIPVLALTASLMPQDTEEYLRAGMCGYVAKPIDRTALAAALELAVTQGAGSRLEEFARGAVSVV